MNMPVIQPEIKAPAISAGFFNLESFELIQRVARAFSESDLVPKQYQKNLPNCMIAMDMAQRIGANPLMVMQNLYVVHGTPGWSSKFLIATVNVSGAFSRIRYEWKGNPGTPEFGCRAWAIEKETGERLDGIWVTWAMVKAEGWDAKNGSKWKTMPDQMFIYRASAFWQRAYAPEISMGLTTAEELHDVYDAERSAGGEYEVKPVADVLGSVLYDSDSAPVKTDAPLAQVEPQDKKPEKKRAPSLEEQAAAAKAGHNESIPGLD